MTRVYRDTLVSYTCEKCGYQWEDYLRGSFTCPKCGKHHTTAWITSGPNLRIAKLFRERVEEERLMREAWRIHASESGLD
jgi:rubrerythrin